MGLRLNEFSPFEITNPDSGEKPSGSLADRGEGMGSVWQGEGCKVGRMPFKISPWYLLGAVGERPGATRAVWDGMRSGSGSCPAQWGPGLGRGRAAVGPGPSRGLAAAPRRPLPACPSPRSHPFKTS